MSGKLDELMNLIRQVILGVAPINEKLKYRTIAVMIALVHLSYVAVFAFCKIEIMLQYNIGAVIYYLVMAVLVGRKEFQKTIFSTMLAEILLHSFLATIMLGFDWGFMLYTISLVPLIFYMCFTLSGTKTRLKIAVTLSMLVFVVYYVTLTASYRIDPLYIESVYSSVPRTMYYYNTVLAFVYCFIISVLFSIEVKYMRVTLEKENLSLEQDAKYDPLTRLYNRRSFNDYLRNAVEAAEKGEKDVSLIMLDIDDFKQVNDTYGHNQGDVVLKEVANVLRDNVREDDVVCRWGGEEMLILLDVSADVASRIAERIRRDVESLDMLCDGAHIKVTLTLGVAEYKGKLTLREFIEVVDKRLYYGKEHGKNMVVNS